MPKGGRDRRGLNRFINFVITPKLKKAIEPKVKKAAAKKKAAVIVPPVVEPVTPSVNEEKDLDKIVASFKPGDGI